MSQQTINTLKRKKCVICGEMIRLSTKSTKYCIVCKRKGKVEEYREEQRLDRDNK